MSELKNHPLKDRTVLVHSSQTDLADLVEIAGGQILRFPNFEIQPPETFAGLDEAIENLYGYDWLIFVTADSVSHFLARFLHLNHETSELDSIKVCAIGESTAATLEGSQIHVDLVSGDLNPAALVESLANYLGGHDKLSGLNFMIPQAAIGRDNLKPPLEDAGARADAIATYRTTAASNSSLFRLRTILTSGGVDCIAFVNPAEVHDFGRVWDTGDLSRLLKNVVIAAMDHETAATARAFGLTATLKPNAPGIQSFAAAISSYFSA